MGDEQFSSFLAALCNADHESSARLLPSADGVAIEAAAAQQPCNDVGPADATEAAPEHGSAANAPRAAPEESFTAVKRSDAPHCSLASLPTVDELKRDRYRAKNRRSQKAYRERMKVCCTEVSVHAATVTNTPHTRPIHAALETPHLHRQAALPSGSSLTLDVRTYPCMCVCVSSWALPPQALPHLAQYRLSRHQNNFHLQLLDTIDFIVGNALFHTTPHSQKV